MGGTGLPDPVVGTHSGSSRGAELTKRRRWKQAGEKIMVGVVPELAGPDRWGAGDQDQGIVLGQLQDLARGQQRPRRFLLGERDVRQEEREPLAGDVLVVP